jgi:molecular chaperone GrpE
MKTPVLRFPFLIIPLQGDVPGRRPVPMGENREDPEKLLESIEEIKLHTGASEEKMSKLVKKIGLLESALDEFLETPGKQDNLEDFFERFIPVLDNLRFLRRAVEDSGDEEWKKGIEMFYRKLFNFFLEFGFEPSAQIGMTFDPARHESVETAVNPDLPPGSLAEVLLDGWTYKGRVLRYAKVVVVSHEAAASPGDV